MNGIVTKLKVAPLEDPVVASKHFAPHVFEVSCLLKTIGHEGRLMILCHLSNGERTVTQLQELLPAPQALVSSQLARLRHEGMVKFRKQGQTKLYALADKKAWEVLNLVNTLFCDGLKDHQ